MNRLRPVILSGGSGTRLWPLSTPALPKQFVRLFDGRSLFELTLGRLDGIDDLGSPLVVTGSGHLDLARDGLAAAGVETSRILVEPTGRNTAPAVIAAALVAEPDDILVILPSDHLITDVGAFRRAVVAAARHASDGAIMTFGIQPSRAETGYGYIEIGQPLGEGAFTVERFKEKPDAAEAERLVADGRHVWNSGMFVARAGSLLAEGMAHCPGIVEEVKAAVPAVDHSLLELAAGFGDVEATSIDYAIMERTNRAGVLSIDVGWDDVGSYQSLLQAVARDGKGNHIEGDVTVSDVTGSFVVATSRKVAVAGLEDVVVVETPDAVLVLPLDRSQDVRDLARQSESR